MVSESVPRPPSKLMKPTGAKKLPWESQPHFLVFADERKRDLIVEDGLRPSKKTRYLQTAEAHEFLSRHNIKIKRPEIGQTMVRDIDSFNIEILRSNSERHNFIENFTAAAEVLSFPADNTSSNKFK